jgi:hypothetical protein
MLSGDQRIIFRCLRLARADYAVACQEACGAGLDRQDGGAGYKRRNKRPSFIRDEFEAAPGGGGAVVAARSEFDPAIDDPEIEPVDEAAIAALLTKIPHARPRPFAI